MTSAAQYRRGSRVIEQQLSDDFPFSRLADRHLARRLIQRLGKLQARIEIAAEHFLWAANEERWHDVRRLRREGRRMQRLRSKLRGLLDQRGWRSKADPQ